MTHSSRIVSPLLIAENIQNRIFYEESTHDRVIAILRGYKDQGFGYLDSCTELSHVFLRMLERYSKENVNLQVRSRRRARRSKKYAAKQRGELNEDDDQEQASEMEDVIEAERASKERKFDFARFSAKFMTQACVDTFVSFTKYYSDLNTKQLKRAHRFFYRVAFKRDLSVVLFRLDIVMLFNKMIKGPEGLDPAGVLFKEWDELVKQLIRKLIKKLEQRPELAIELLFSKINSTIFYLEYGYEKQTSLSKPRAPTALEVRGSMTIEEQIGVAVAVLYHENIEQIDWIIKTLASAASERLSWEAEAAARQELEPSFNPESVQQQETSSKAPSVVVIPDPEATRIAMFKDSKLRLLMALAGFERLSVEDEPNATWIIPSSLTSAQLKHTRDIIEQHRNRPVFDYGEDDPMTAEELLRRKPTEKTKRAEYDDDSEGDGIVGDNVEEEFLFPPNQRLSHKSALNELKRKRRKRHTVSSGDESELDEAPREARRKARELADLEKRRKIKSHDFVGDSDDESDEERDREFFAREEARRKGQRQKIMEVLHAGRITKAVEDEEMGPSGTNGKVNRKRKSEGVGEDKGKRRRRNSFLDRSEEETHTTAGDGEMATASSSPHGRVFSVSSSDDESAMEDTPLSSPPLGGLSLSKESRKTSAEPITSEESMDKGPQTDDEDVEVSLISTARRRARPFLDDSDDE